VILYEHIPVTVVVKPKGYVQYGDIRVWVGSGLLSDRTFEDIWTLTRQATLLLPCVRIYKEQLKPDMSVQEVGAFLKVAELLDDHTTKVEAPEDDEMPEVPVMQLPHLDIHIGYEFVRSGTRAHQSFRWSFAAPAADDV
jgi:hypothetical protein